MTLNQYKLLHDIFLDYMSEEMLELEDIHRVLQALLDGLDDVDDDDDGDEDEEIEDVSSQENVIKLVQKVVG